jgi:hypothetical protein
MGNAESENPYEIGDSEEAVAESDTGAEQRPQKLLKDPSVTSEPWMSTRTYQPDPTDTGSPGSNRPGATTPEHSVWDEPGLSRELSGDVPDDAVTWFRHHQQQSRKTSATKAWFVTFLVVLVSGPCAILGTFLSGQGADFPVVYISIIGPTVEELMKLALVLWIVETRPWLFRSSFQILICMTMSGLVFAAVENVFYLEMPIREPSPQLAQWRWTVCVALHTGCCIISGSGAAIIWRKFQTEERPPQLNDGARWILTAIVIHGVYNFSMVLVQLLDIDLGL